MAFTKTLETDWKAIEAEWNTGATSQELQQRHGVSAATIRSYARRRGWLEKNAVGNSKILKRASQIAVKKAVARTVSKIESKVAYTVEECVNESIDLGRAFMQQAKEKLLLVEDGNLSAVATLGRTGVDIARKSLGLDATGAASVSCAIQFNFVAKGVDAFGATQDATPSATGEAVDV